MPASVDREITISGGPRKRVALTSALLRETPVLFLDDALSAVDAETEATILEARRIDPVGKVRLFLNYFSFSHHFQSRPPAFELRTLAFVSFF